jgi:hypothetical protein
MPSKQDFQHRSTADYGVARGSDTLAGVRDTPLHHSSGAGRCGRDRAGPHPRRRSWTWPASPTAPTGPPQQLLRSPSTQLRSSMLLRMGSFMWTAPIRFGGRTRLLRDTGTWTGGATQLLNQLRTVAPPGGLSRHSQRPVSSARASPALWWSGRATRGATVSSPLRKLPTPPPRRPALSPPHRIARDIRQFVRCAAQRIPRLT